MYADPFSIDVLFVSAVEAMAKINDRVQKVRYVGFFAGAASTYLYLQTRKKGHGYMKTFAFCTGGAILASIFLQPLAIMASSGDLKKVEDPRHLAEVLQSAKQEREARRPGQPPQRPFPSNQAPPAQGTQQPNTNLPPRAPDSRGSSSQTNQWGDDIGGGVGSQDYGGAPSPFQLPQAGSSQGSSQPLAPSSSDVNNASSGEQAQSRWGQLRGERSVRESSWDRIRQQNARETYNRQSANGQGQAGQAAYSQEGGFDADRNFGGQNSGSYGQERKESELADPTFGKGVSASRSQAQEEYERSFERERRGIDGRGSFN
jgi:hypothetical protein